MSSRRHHHTILWIEGIGFSLLIVLAWLAEFTGMPQFFYETTDGFNWVRPLCKTIVVGAIWAAVHISTKRLLKRLYRLEEFLLVCSWCRKIGHDGAWKTTEEYFGSAFATETSHGVCPDCSKRLVDAVMAEGEGADASDRPGRSTPVARKA
jgi:hypothetical protein